jgi:hypothetical protein
MRRAGPYRFFFSILFAMQMLYFSTSARLPLDGEHGWLRRYEKATGARAQRSFSGPSF